jgi:hypothetical protein
VKALGHPSSEVIETEIDGRARIVEIAEILAAGLTRLDGRKSRLKPTESGESSLHSSPEQSGGLRSYSAEASHD